MTAGSPCLVGYHGCVWSLPLNGGILQHESLTKVCASHSNPNTNNQAREKNVNGGAELTEHRDVDAGRLHHPGLPGHKVGDLTVEEVVVDFLCHRHAQLACDGEQATGLSDDSGSPHF